jgi:palmitoyltransferase
MLGCISTEDKWFQYVIAVLRRVPGFTPLLGVGNAVLQYVFHQPNPLFQLLYCIVIGTCYTVFVQTCWSHFPNSLAGALHREASVAVILACVVSFAWVCSSPPIKVGKGVSRYRFDGLMFKEKNKCVTCKLVKPARSKHCSVCGVCVQRFDHHCVWINGCVGRGNHRLFVLFLFVHVMLCFYGFFLLSSVLYHIVVDQNLIHATFVDGRGNTFKATSGLIFRYVMLKHLSVITLMVLALVMGCALAIFLGYHVWLVLRNKTTNETAKISDLYWELYQQQEALKQVKKNDKTLPIGHLTKEQIQRSERFYDRGLWKNILEVLWVE